MNMIGPNGELMLYGMVGGDAMWGDGFAASDVINALATMRGKPVTVRINSGGGIADEGVAIYHALKQHDGEVTCVVDSVAASAASLIAMAGKQIVMRTGTCMMIHDPAVITMGDVEDHAKSIEYLEVTAAGMAAIYAARTGKTPAKCRADMKEEIWLTPDDAVSEGYADKTDAAAAVEATAFDYRMYAKAPETLRALAATKGWQSARRKPAAVAAQPQSKKETEMTQNSEPKVPAPASDADKAVADAMARATAIIEACANAGVPAMAATLIREGVTVEQAIARADGAKTIRESVAQAAKVCAAIDPAIADAYIAAGASVEKVRADLFNKLAEAQAATPTRSAFTPQPTGNDSATIEASWSAAAAKVNKQFGFTPRA